MASRDVVDAWMQHPTLRFMEMPWLASLWRWTGNAAPTEELPIDLTVAALDAGGASMGLLSAWTGPMGTLVSNDEVAGWVAAHPDRFAGIASFDIRRPLDAVRGLRERVEQGFVGMRVLPWLWETPPTDRRFYPLLATCAELGIPFCTQVGHTGPLMPSEPGRPIPYIDQIALDFPELVIVGGHIGYPWTEETIAVARKHENFYIDTSAYVPRRYPPELVAYMRSKSGRRKVLWGTNYPMISPELALEGVDGLGLDDEALDLFLAGNARRVFGLGERA